MVKFLKSGFTWLYNTTNIKRLFFVCLASSLVSSTFFSILFVSFEVKNINNPLDAESIPFKIFTAIIVAPLLETYLFQYLLNKGLIKCRINKFSLLLLIQTVIFTLFHFYSIFYIIEVFWVCGFINFFYLRAKNLTTSYIKYTVLLHASYNLIVLLLSYF